jgi:hypothetical protein
VLPEFFFAAAEVFTVSEAEAIVGENAIAAERTSATTCRMDPTQLDPTSAIARVTTL